MNVNLIQIPVEGKEIYFFTLKKSVKLICQRFRKDVQVLFFVIIIIIFRGWKKAVIIFTFWLPHRIFLSIFY